MGYFMNEGDIDHAVDVHVRGIRHWFRPDVEPTPITAIAASYLTAYRDIVNENSDGWHCWGSDKAEILMKVLEGQVPATQENLDAGIRRIKAFCKKRNLPLPQEPHAAKVLALPQNAAAPSENQLSFLDLAS
jgi:hypothetical protein